MSAPQNLVWELRGEVKVLKAKFMAASNDSGSFSTRINICNKAGITGPVPTMVSLSGIKNNVIINKVNYLFGMGGMPQAFP